MVKFLSIISLSVLLVMQAVADQRAAKLDQLLKDIRLQQNIPALAVAIIEEGKPFLQKVYLADDERPLPASASFRIASISKLFTGQAVLQLQEQGLLQLDQPVGKFIPALKNYDIQILDLLSHASGLEDKVSPSSKGETIFDDYLAQSLEDQPPRLRSERGFHYADINFNILAELVHRVSGKDFDQYIDQKLLRPLGLKNSHYYRSIKDRPDLEPVYNIGFNLDVSQRPFDPIYFGSEGLISSAEDLSLWLQAVLKQDPRLLKFSSYQLMQAPRLPTSWGSEMGLAWQLGKLQGQPSLQHAGSLKGYRSLLLALPDKKRGIIILSNAQNTPRFEIAAAINKIMNYQEASLPDSKQGKYRIYIVIMFASLMMINYWWWQRKRKGRQRKRRL